MPLNLEKKLYFNEGKFWEWQLKN